MERTRCHVIAIAASALALFGATPATALAQSPMAPTSAQLEWARGIAVAYWRVAQPPCGREHVSVGPVPAAAWASWSTCTITFNSSRDWRDFPREICRLYVHEFGHLVLGPAHFAAINPTDPMHSPDPSNIMFGGDPSAVDEERQEVAIGCITPPGVSRAWSQPAHRTQAARHRPSGTALRVSQP